AAGDNPVSHYGDYWMPAFAGMTTFPAGLRPRGLRGMARRKAQTYGVRDPFGTTAGASRRANGGRLRHRALLFPLEGRVLLPLKLGPLKPHRTWGKRRDS